MGVEWALAGFVYLLETLLLLVLGKFLFCLVHRRCNFKEELVERDNLALAIAVSGYLLGLGLAVGGVLSGPGTSLMADSLGILLYGTVAAVLLNVSVAVNDWLILDRFSMEKEIVQDRNCGVGAVAAANHIAVGLILYGLLSGEGGGIVALLVFWGIGQLTLVLACRLYCRVMPYGVQDAMERDNVAVGVAFAGMIVAVGNILRTGLQGHFTSWSDSLGSFASVMLFGLVIFPLARLATDKLIVPGHRLTKELIEGDGPNVGAGILEGIMYIITSFLIGWSIA